MASWSVGRYRLEQTCVAKRRCIEAVSRGYLITDPVMNCVKIGYWLTGVSGKSQIFQEITAISYLFIEGAGIYKEI